MKYLFFIIGISFFSLSARANNLQVGKGKLYATIREALQRGVDGDTVSVFAGIYREKNLKIEKRLLFRGIGQPVLDGEYACEIISVKASGVIIEGFTVIHSAVSSIIDYAAIRIYGVRNVVIRNNVLKDNFFGIYSQAGTHCNITNNQITASALEEQQSGNGIHCWKSDSMFISGNQITGHRDGIYFEFLTHSLITGNHSEKNIRYGMHFMFSSYDTYIGNTFKNNGAGVAVMFSHDVTMTHNLFTDNWGDAAYGLLLKEIADGTIHHNRFIRNTMGIFMEGASRLQVSENLFDHNGWALKIQASCMDNTVTRNNFLSNTFDVGTNGNLVLNTFDRNYWDKYEGYDLNRDRIGDIPYRPVSMYSVIIEKNPPAMMLFRSLITTLLDKTEKVLPSLTPDKLKDAFPLMKPLPL